MHQSDALKTVTGTPFIQHGPHQRDVHPPCHHCQHKNVDIVLLNLPVCTIKAQNPWWIDLQKRDNGADKSVFIKAHILEKALQTAIAGSGLVLAVAENWAAMCVRLTVLTLTRRMIKLPSVSSRDLPRLIWVDSVEMRVSESCVDMGRSCCCGHNPPFHLILTLLSNSVV